MGPWDWHPHPAAWLLIFGLGAAYVLGAAPAASRRRRLAFAAGLLSLAAAVTWPLGDLAGHWSVLAHMGSHLLLVLVAPPLLLIGLPEPVVVRLTAPPAIDRALVNLTHPLMATLLFNAAIVGAHLPAVMNASIEQPVVHTAVHAGLFTAALIMWLTALRLLPGARRLGYGGRIGFLALQSLVPNIPAAVLLFSGAPLYTAYGERPRQLGMSPLLDQQLGGALVKLVAVTILAGAAAVLFFRWNSAERLGQGGRDTEPLTWADVERELTRSSARPPAR